MMENRKRKILVNIGLWFAAAAFGSTFFMTKYSLTDINPVTLVTYRFLIATVILGIVLLSQGKKLFKNYKTGLVLGIFFWILYDLQTIGLKYTSASNSGFITGSFVIFVPIFAFILFKIRPTINKVLGVLAALLGLWFLTGGLKNINVGDVLTIFVAVVYALQILFADKYVRADIQPDVLAFQQFFFVTVLSFVTGIFWRDSLQFHSETTLMIILYLGLIPTLAALTIQLIAQKYASPVKVALIFATEPLFAALFTWTIGGEKFVLLKAIGGLFIVLGIVISELKNTTVPGEASVLAQ